MSTPTPNALRPLRSFQERALETVRASLAAGKRRPLLMMPTGAGKTLTSAHIIRRALDKGNAVIFAVPALSLVDQTAGAFEAEGINCIGVMQGSHPRTDPDQPVQICSVQTLARRQTPNAAIVIVDEAHQMHKSVLKWMTDSEWARVPFIGLSATPWARGLGRYFDDLIVAATTADLIRDGYLSPFVAFAPSEPDLSGVRTVAGEFQQDELSDAMDKASITGDIAGTWLKRGEGRSTFCFCVNRRHAQHVAERFLEVGAAAEYMDGNTPREEREAVFSRFRSGETRIICNVGVLTTGIDLDVRCIIDAKPTKSRILFVQTIGRGLRKAESKENLLVLDHAGNHLRLGMVTGVHQTHLDDGKKRDGSAKKKERSEPLPKLCPECKAVLGYRARECSACGAQIIAVTEVHEADGDLVELGARKSGERKATLFDMAHFFAELRGYAQHKGYAEGWAAHKFKEKFGVWPNGVGRNVVAPGLTTLNWIRSRQIAFAKRRRFG
jgi:DNA repair protein RadD